MNFFKEIDKKTIISLVISLIVGAFIGTVIIKGKLMALLLLPLISGAIFYILFSFRNPQLPLKSIIIFGFFVIGITRYVEGPFGLLIDGILIFTWIIITILPEGKIEWWRANNIVVYFLIIWFIYITLQLLNPYSIGAEPWFYAMRGMALYPMLLTPLAFLLLKTKKDLDWIIKIWFIISVLAAIKGFQQKYFECDPFEKRWLAQGGYITHVLFGQLRAFSFYSDAGQFGGAMGHASISAFILFTGKYRLRVKLLYLFLAVFFFWGYLISGTRGAIAVPAAGMIAYLLLSKNFKILISGLIISGLFYFFIAHTLIGQGTYEIRRLRTAFTDGSDDASMIVRTENKKKFAAYLSDKPFGGGVGAAGDWGKRFRPDSILANIATDGFYVRIWSETGIVGLVLFLSFFIYFVIRGGLIVWFIKDPELRNKLLALYCGVIGIMAASYGNSVFSQSPTNIICYISIAFILSQGNKLADLSKAS